MTDYDRELEELEQELNGALTATKEDKKQKSKPRKDSTPKFGSLLDYVVKLETDDRS